MVTSFTPIRFEFSSATVCNQLLYNVNTVARLMKIKPSEILDLREWEHVLWMRQKGKRPRFVSKKQLLKMVAKFLGNGFTRIELAPKISVLTHRKMKATIAHIVYPGQTQALYAKNSLLRQGEAKSIDLQLTGGVIAGQWELKIKGMSTEKLLQLAFVSLEDEAIAPNA